MLRRVALAVVLTTIAAPAVAGDGLIYDMTDFWKPKDAALMAAPGFSDDHPPYVPLAYDIDPLVDPYRRVAWLEYEADDVARRDARVFYKPESEILPYDLERLVGLAPRGARFAAAR